MSNTLSLPNPYIGRLGQDPFLTRWATYPFSIMFRRAELCGQVSNNKYAMSGYTFKIKFPEKHFYVLAEKHFDVQEGRETGAVWLALGNDHGLGYYWFHKGNKQQSPW